MIHRISADKQEHAEIPPVCELPGLGLPSPPPADPASLSEAWPVALDSQSANNIPPPALGDTIHNYSVYGGSLEFSQRLVPAIFIEGTGFVPLSHPAVEPFIDPVHDRPETNPNIVMVPEYRLMRGAGSAPYWPELNGSTPNGSTDMRIVDSSGSTLLSMPKPENIEPIIVSSKTGWVKQTERFSVYFLEGDCSIRQGNSSVQAPQAVVWVDRHRDEAQSTYEVTVYAESDSPENPLRLEFDPDKIAAKIQDKKWFGRFTAGTSAQILIMQPKEAGPEEPAIYHRAMGMMSPDYSVIRQAQYSETLPTTAEVLTQPPRFRRITFNRRGDKEHNAQSQPYPNNDSNRWITIITNGMNLIIEGVDSNGMLLGDIVDISADNAVVWSGNPTKMFRGGGEEDSNLDFEVYLEGNIIFRDQERTIQAQRMYYDAKHQIAYILNGELKSPIVDVKGITGSIRVKAEILQQLGDGLFTARNSLVTTSMLGEPTYSLRSRKLTLQQRPGTRSCWGEDHATERQVLIAENNYLALQNMPVFYWPWMAADLRDPTFYIKNIAYGHSDSFGSQIRTKWNPFQLLNIRSRPSWLNGDVGLTWLEKRGFAHSADFQYSPSSFCSIAGPVDARLSFWGLSDRGKTDRLGGDRNAVPFKHKYRYRFFWKHQQEIESFCNFQGPWVVSAQVGKVSDRNLLNSYFSSQWRNDDNETTSVAIKKFCDSSSLSLRMEYNLNDFYTNPNWLPRLDHYVLGKSLLNDRLTWYGHTRVGLVDYNTATSPYATDLDSWNQDAAYFRYLPWELHPDSPSTMPARPDSTDPAPRTVDSSFEVFSTRHELDLPFNIGPLRCVPYVLGEFSHWGKDRSGDDVQRLYGQAGVRLNLPFWKIMPGCSSRTWYVNGLAHKLDFDTELSYSRANKDMDRLILTDSLDTWSIEDFRRRYAVTTFNASSTGSIPTLFDPRYYALRSGMGGNVSASNMEIADDMTLVRFGMTHRFQTKRGPVGRRRIIDWITVAVHFTFFPEKEQNSYYDENPAYTSSKSIGLVDYDFLWHVGDRFSIFSSGLFDHEQSLTKLGAIWQRPERGSFSVMLDDFQGVIQRTYLTLAVGYDMNEKYSVAYSTSYEIRKKWENVGHNFMFTRTGESFRIVVGAIYNESRKEWSFSFGLEPVFMRGILSKMGGMSSASQSQFSNR